MQASSISVDASGNLYIAGTIQGGTANFASNGSVYSLTPQNTNSSAGDAFVAKLDNNGNLVWATDLGGTGNTLASGVAVDSAGNVDVAGSFTGTANFGTGNTTVSLTSSGGTDAYLAQLNATGNLVWAQNWGTTGNDAAQAIAVDTSGNIYLAGSFQARPVPIRTRACSDYQASAPRESSSRNLTRRATSFGPNRRADRRPIRPRRSPSMLTRTCI